jgi:RNA polymerase sigma factor (sigma-70 family)
MTQALPLSRMADQDRQISDVVVREQPRLRNFIRRRVANPRDAEDILQDVFAELVEAYRLMKPIEQVGAWLFRVARNRITDLFRKKRPEALDDQHTVTVEGELLLLEDLLPSKDAGPEEVYARSVLLDALEDALEELPIEQRDVFIAHEIDRRSFRELAAETGLSVNTLLSRKHYAVLHLRRRLQEIYKEFSAKKGR